jgi:hypothetical protein
VEDNSHAGQGAVLLDIGGTVGALVLSMPPELLGEEIEIRPAGQAGDHHHEHDDHDPDHGPGHHHLPHVAVVNRPCDGRNGTPVATAVFAEVEHGDYELYVRPSGPVRLTVTVRGAEVSYARWPAG